MGSRESPNEPLRPNLEKIAEAKIGHEAAKHILWSGWVDVGEGQKLYVIEWGKKGGNPRMCLHGGPGDSTRPSHAALFDPETDHVLFLNQRGCGESTPNAAAQTKEEIQETNTPAHIIRDMEELREHFGMEKVHLAGGSWGSALGLLYGIEHPERTASLELWSLYLATREQTLSIFEDKTGETGFPDMCKGTWQEFVGLVPEERRGMDANGRVNPAAIMEYYAGKEGTNHSDPEIARKFAEAYLIYEYALCQPDGSETDPKEALKQIREAITGDPNSLAAARIEMTYDVNGTFIEDNHIFNNVDRLKGIPITIVQGKRDWCTPTRFARMLEEKLGKPCVEEVESGHLRSDRAMVAALRKNIHDTPSVSSGGE